LDSKSDQKSRNAARHGFRLVIPGLHRYVKSARRFVGSVCRIAGVGDEVRDALALALTEIVNNSIDHGHAARGEPLELDLEVHDDRVRLVVTESGESGWRGVDVERAAREARKTSLDDTQFRGRGLLLVCSLMDEMKVHSEPGSGTVVEVVKYRGKT
jgi:serine/threonine-protein kinase RsbW